MPETVEALLAKMFIARPDVMAEQRSNGIYTPVHSRFTRSALAEHLAGERSLGHYLLNQENRTKLFAFDIDWEKAGHMPIAFDSDGIPTNWIESRVKKNATTSSPEEPALNPECSPRAFWRSRRYIGRDWMKGQMMNVAWSIAGYVHKELGLRCALAYSGYKGIHVYAFAPVGQPMLASDAREGALLVLEGFAEATAVKGNNFYRFPDKDELDHNENISIEVFPKQTTVQEGGFGNLMRLPLGRNLKAPSDPTFFIDLSRSSMRDWAAVKPENVATYLQSGNPFQ